MFLSFVMKYISRTVLGDLNNIETIDTATTTNNGEMGWFGYLACAGFMSQIYVSARNMIAMLSLSILIGSRFVGYFSIGK